MRKNISPWIHQLDANRTHRRLESDLDTDVAIVGAGIAGISTAFFILKNTDERVCLLERFKLAHGATGHNAGQIVSYFERSYGEFVRLEPPMRGLNLMLWILPVVMLLGGVSFVVLRARPSKAQAGPGAVPIGEQKPDPALAKYVERIRRDAGISS